MTARLPEAYQWLLVPKQANPQASVTWHATRVTGSDALAVRASKKLRGDELLVTSLGSTILRKHLDDVPLWRGDHVPIRQLDEDFARYLYLSRLAGPKVLAQALSDGIGLLTWQSDTFTYGETYDETAKRYRGLRGGQVTAIDADSPALVVKAEIARQQLDAELQEATPPVFTPVDPGKGTTGRPPTPAPSSTETRPRRFYGTVHLDPTRVGRDASRIADEVIAHLAGQVDAEVSVTLEIEAELPNGASEQLRRTVTESSQALKFTSHGFENDLSGFSQNKRPIPFRTHTSHTQRPF